MTWAFRSSDSRWERSFGAADLSVGDGYERRKEGAEDVPEESTM